MDDELILEKEKNYNKGLEGLSSDTLFKIEEICGMDSIVGRVASRKRVGSSLDAFVGVVLDNVLKNGPVDIKFSYELGEWKGGNNYNMTRNYSALNMTFSERNVDYEKGDNPSIQMFKNIKYYLDKNSFYVRKKSASVVEVSEKPKK